MSAQLEHSPQLPRVQPSHSPHRCRLSAAARLLASAAAADEAARQLVAPPPAAPPPAAPPFEAESADAEGVAAAVGAAPEAEAALRDWVCLPTHGRHSSSRAAARAAPSDW